MKRTSIAALAVAVLALSGTQAAFADDNHHGKGKQTQQLIEVTGTIKALAAPNIAVTVRTASMSDRTRTIARAMLRAVVVNFGTDTNTVIRRGNANNFPSLVIGDKVELRAKCTLTPLTCLATRVTAAPAPAPRPSPLHLGFALEGVVTANSGTQFNVVVVRASAGDDTALKPRSILGTPYTVFADTTTAVLRGGGLVGTGFAAVSTVTPYAAVNVSGTCTSTLPVICTAKRITVIVPTA